MDSHGGHGAPPQDELDPDEPRTPLWLPLLGLSLFVMALVYFLTGADRTPPKEEPEAASASAAPAPAPPPAP